LEYLAAKQLSVHINILNCSHQTSGWCKLSELLWIQSSYGNF